MPTAAGACYTLTFPASTTEMFDATLDTTGVAHVAFFAEHVPTEFEFDTHYFMSTDLATDIEPVAQTDPQEYNCRFHTVNGVNSCAQAFYIIQAHHDYCPTTPSPATRRSSSTRGRASARAAPSAAGTTRRSTPAR